MPAALPLVSASPLAPLKRNLAIVVEGFIVVFQNAADAPGCPDRNHLPIFASLGQPQSFLCCPAEKSTLSNVSRLYVSPIVTSRGPEIPTSSRNKVTGCTAVQEHLGRPLEPPSASEPASTPLACCTPWSGDPNDHTDGHRIIPCPWNRFHLCEVPMHRNHLELPGETDWASLTYLASSTS
eukprot:g26151.t1